MDNLVFLKLGGSLITDKDKPRTPRLDSLNRLAAEIAAARKRNPELHLVLGHGSGSFGHQSAARHNTIQGVHSAEDWRGFAEVWQDAHDLNQIVIKALQNAGLPVISFSPSASVLTANHRIARWDISPVQTCLKHSLVPLIHGDVVFDSVLGGTILSTENLFSYLAESVNPHRICLAGIEPGIWADYPANTTLISRLTSDGYAKLSGLSGSGSTDVTGGMRSKVDLMFHLIDLHPHLTVSIFSGLESRAVTSALTGAFPGTTLSST